MKKVFSTGEPVAKRPRRRRGEMKQKLYEEAVSFRYRKVSGALRPATGTLNVEYQRKTDALPNWKILTYYDMERGDWRSAKVEKLDLDQTAY